MQTSRDPCAHPGTLRGNGQPRLAATTVADPKWSRVPWAALLALALGLAFQGSRGLWEPDEGYYANVAVGMLRSGDWFTPRLNDLVFLDKPPLHYWDMAAGMALLGVNEWGARLANAFWFAGTALTLELLGRRLWDRRTGRLAALVYTTTLLPFVAANVLTPDTTLAFWTTCCALCHVMATGLVPCARPGRWWMGLGVCVGLGMLAKGPAVFIFVAPLAAELLLRNGRSALRSGWPFAAALSAAAIAAVWYVPMMLSLPGAGPYFLSNEVVGRLFTASYRRNAGWMGGFEIYLPILAAGSLPWSLAWPAFVARWRRRAAAAMDPRDRLLLWWILAPIVVLLAARSRLPLYILPVFAPLSLATTRVLLPAWHSARRRRALLAFSIAWISCLVGVKASSDRIDTNRDSRSLARELRTLLPDPGIEVIGVDRKLNGLSVYGYRDFEWVTLRREDYPFFSLIETLDEELAENRQEGEHVAYLVPRREEDVFGRLAAASGMGCQRAGQVQGSAVFLCAPASRTASVPPGG